MCRTKFRRHSKKADDILDLKDFIQDYCDKSEHIQENFDLDDCEFVVKKSPEYQTKCLFIVGNDLEEQISTENFGNLPTPMQNFRSFCTYTIREYKKCIRQKLSKKYDQSFNDVDLWHQSPTTKQIVDEFIDINNLRNKLEEIVSPNGMGNNVPYLLTEYEYLQKKFLNFYHKKVARDDINFELRERKND